MRILHVLARLRHSGAERMLACSFENWRAAGIEPVIVGMADGEHPYAAALSEAGYEVVFAPQLRSAAGLAALRRTVAAVRPRIVHIHSESCCDAVALVSALSPGVFGAIRTVHSNFRFTGLLRARRTARVAFARRLGVVWVACSAEVGETERSFSAREVRIVENWVDVDAIAREAAIDVRRQRCELGVAPDAAVVTLVGNCGSAKNHELIPLALRTVERPVHVLHVGDGALESQAERRAWQQLPARHTVHRLGSRTDVPRLLAASDLFLSPSLYEGLSLATVEALCVGVPVLAADTVGQRWIGAIPSSELLPLEPAAWGQSIAVRLLRGRDSQAIREAAGQAQSRFRAERGVAEYVEAYEAALRGRFRRPFARSRLTAWHEGRV
jgi:glycosyltransferase involved in cell wall biosynthesis